MADRDSNRDGDVLNLLTYLNPAFANRPTILTLSAGKGVKGRG